VALGLCAGTVARALPATPAEIADDTTTHSFREVSSLDQPRVISWRAVSHEKGGRFVLLRLGSTVREVARIHARPGAHDYRFVDDQPEDGSIAVIYRLAYLDPSGAARLLHEATVAAGSFRDPASGAEPGPGAKIVSTPIPTVVLPATVRALRTGSAPAVLFPPTAPEPPPPWS
jgi:hypothetical protein